MVDERESPSAGWRAIYREMAADPSVEEATHPCPDCGRPSENVLRDVYECDEHGVFRASADDGEKTLEASTDETDVADAEKTVAEETEADAEKAVADDAEKTEVDDAGETDADDASDDADEVENRAREPAD